MKSCYLEFHFSHEYLSNQGLAFSNPVAVLETMEIERVRPLLKQLEEYVKAGYYAAGFLSYEAAPAFDRKMKVRSSQRMPLLWFGIFLKPTAFQSLDRPMDVPLQWQHTQSKKAYEEALQTIHHYIEEGESYQVNYTTRLTTAFTVEDLTYFAGLRSAQEANYSAYLNIGTQRILSSSPELFFAWNGQDIMTKPMKGTIARGLTFEEDEKQRDVLANSEKDQSENVMIVDLLRNDLGKIAVPGSVQVSHLYQIETYPTVHQMTSTVTAKTLPTTTLTDIFTALFPCGSITGAPKIRTMEIIAELETLPRDVYCGAIGYLTPDGSAVFNVPIRTVWVDTETKRAEYGVGGGITWESAPDSEYDEILTKGKVLSATKREFQLLESLRLEKHNYILLEKHLQRLKRSACYFHFRYDEIKVRSALEQLKGKLEDGIYKIRLLLDKNGKLTLEHQRIASRLTQYRVALANTPIIRTSPFLYHKTTQREIYAQQRIAQEDYFDTLLWNEKGNLTEFTTGNVVCLLNGRYVTPPITDGLLNGCFRQELLEKGTIQEATVSINDLKQVTALWLINSVRGWVPVTLEEYGTDGK
ncbi:aminodeoxychorismate synthase, component I [Pullulanibacillus camelliae]|uniref:Aminodeoxychorismate synthase, component I n=1 Tax=Pullulanibacillus camelliae TaxID=1707096 RepID=A0A8J2W1P7_9BACL|nr:aminodeoxychorismate synthase component I [Pullulanibacillus camelliae]GGE40435.1 aminodeoxychorismate synthase, component I [Pullulanibacillus camelliae]